MIITVVTIFPDMFPGPLSHGLSGKFLGKLWKLNTVNIRDFARDRHKTVDDTPYGGGAGMIMKPDVVHEAMIEALRSYEIHPNILFMTPKGSVFSQKRAREIMKTENSVERGLIILCGRYEGIDERVIQFWKKNHGLKEVSIGDYILFGGEIPAMVVIDSCLRLLPGMMNNCDSTEDETFSVDLLEYPQYTKPAVWMEENVPSVLLSGNHEKIAKWRTEQSKQITKDLRLDMWEKYIKIDCEDV